MIYQHPQNLPIPSTDEIVAFFSLCGQTDTQTQSKTDNKTS